MRRGINIRKKKRITQINLNKKSLKLLIILSVLLILCMCIYIFFIQNMFIKKEVNQDSSYFSALNNNIPFSVQKIILFSSATADANTVNQQLSLDISNYCDIGIYLNNIDETNTSIKSLYIDNINLSSPELGTPYLYKKRIDDLGKSSFNEELIIQDNFYFNIIEPFSEINYKNYELFNNCSTPITLGFYNKNIKEDFITDNSEILYNGTLLKDAIITTTSLNCNISFTINIITNNDEHYISNINFDIPFENSGISIYENGYITKELRDTNSNNFIRLK